jgi:hypothetical protein
MKGAQPIKGRSNVSINPVGGVASTAAQQQPAGAAKPESTEAPGVAEHDGDADDTATTAATAAKAAFHPGTLNVKA